MGLSEDQEQLPCHSRGESQFQGTFLRSVNEGESALTSRTETWVSLIWCKIVRNVGVTASGWSTRHHLDRFLRHLSFLPPFSDRLRACHKLPRAFNLFLSISRVPRAHNLLTSGGRRSKQPSLGGRSPNFLGRRGGPSP